MKNLELTATYDPVESLAFQLILAFEEELWRIAIRRAARRGQSKVLVDDIKSAASDIFVHSLESKLNDLLID